ncbi:MAG: hypothetical protein ACI9J3_003862 [Parvicellaceae bacterium]|jgi:hypothetical protein
MKFTFLLSLLGVSLIGLSQQAVVIDSNSFDSQLLLENLQAFSADSMAGRGTDTEGGNKSIEFVSSRFEALHLLKFDGSYTHKFDFANQFLKSKMSGTNVMGWIKGSKNPDKYIVISSHHDHLGTKDGEIYNGADDNGSGTCGLFSIAEYFSKNPPRSSIIFVAFDAEENGLIGSKHFVNKPPVALKKIKFNLNMDMVSRDEKQQIFICGTAHYAKLKPLFNEVDTLSTINVTFGHDSGAMRSEDWTYASDHGSFHKKKIPFVYLGVEDHVDYHKPTDTFDRIDNHFYLEAIRVALRITTLVDQSSKNLK